MTNEDAVKIYMLTRGQVRTMVKVNQNGVPYSEVSGMDHCAVWAAIDAYGVRDRTGTFEKVLRLFYHFQTQGD